MKPAMQASELPRPTPAEAALVAAGPATTCLHRLHIAADHPAFAGHFPGAPILPGVALLAAVFEGAAASETLRACIGAAPQLRVLKLSGTVPPDTDLAIAFKIEPRTLAWQISDGERTVASGEFARADCCGPLP